MLVAIALLSSAFAQECDAEALAKTATDASPAGASAAYEQLARCAPERAAAIAGPVFERMLPGTDAHESIRLGVEAGATEPVKAFLGRMEADQRSRALVYLGKKCDSPKISAFFIDAHATLGDEFWKQRWGRGLADCRTDEVRKLLTDSLGEKETGVGAIDRARFFSVLEVYSRNLRGDALPTLQKFARELKDPEEVTYVINAFADAAGVGSLEGVDRDTATRAVAAIVELGPDLPPLAVDQARTTLLALDAERESDALAKYRWPAAYRNFGYKYGYAAVAVERVTCKNGQKLGTFHHATITDGGDVWPDQIPEVLTEKLQFEWGLDDPPGCGGTRELAWAFPVEPFETEEARSAWLAEQKRAFDGSVGGYKKTTDLPHPDVER